MQITIRPVTTKKQLRQFIFLPEKIHRNDSRWVPPLYSDEWKFYNPLRNKSLAECETILFLAYNDESIVGRVMGIIPLKYNESQAEQTARFFNLECINDLEVSHALLHAVERWAISKSVKKLIGPFGFSDKDPQGLQIEGFEYLPVLATATNFPYLRDLVEKENYRKEIDCLVYKLDVPKEIPESYQRVSERLITRNRIQAIEFKSRKELKPFIIPVLKLVNETFRNIFGFVPMDEDEMRQFADKYLPVLDPEFTKLVLDDENNPLAFIVASPDISKGIQKAKGRLFPFGFIHVLLAARRTKQLNLYLGAVQESEKNRGLTAILGLKIFQSAAKRGFSYIDSHLILESNKPMRAVMERLGAVVYKRYRIYSKELNT